MTVETVSPTAGTLVGLDYALVIVTRHRNGLKAGLHPRDAAMQALNTSGRAVLFAGGTVCVALLGLLVRGVSFLSGIAIAAAIVVLLTAVVSITLLPALPALLAMVAELRSPQDKTALNELTAELPNVAGVAAAGPAFVNQDATTGVVPVTSTTSPQDEATSELITRLRTDVAPGSEQGHSLRVHVGGLTAITDDFATTIGKKLPQFIGVVVALGCLLLMLAFRSVLIPLTAALMNLLAAAATFGVGVVVFQWGWGEKLLDVGAGPVEAYLPAILFGLSMNYRVFLVSRMHEEWVRTGHNRRSVSVGIIDTSRVITAAALIMIFVFGSFVFGGQRLVVELGLGMAVAIALAAFVGRGTGSAATVTPRQNSHCYAINERYERHVRFPEPPPRPAPRRRCGRGGTRRGGHPQRGGGTPVRSDSRHTPVRRPRRRHHDRLAGDQPRHRRGRRRRWRHRLPPGRHLRWLHGPLEEQRHAPPRPRRHPPRRHPDGGRWL
ncbi:MMPL family transporter [Amycolatopsis sp. H6(2020)]|nr:MMPL family transporter [Amycolatopsis sp. H6(2020)]